MGDLAVGVRQELLDIVGAKAFFDDPKVLTEYSGDFSVVPPGMPSYVVKPKDVQEVQKIVELANENKTPVVPSSSKVHFHGATIPRQGGIVVDLSRMNKVLEIDEKNRRVRIEAGVTWGQLTRKLGKKGLRMIMPLLPPAERSVVTDYLEREVPTNTVYDYGEPLQGMQVVWPNGEIFRTGSASVPGYPDSPSKGGNPSGPGIDFYRFLQGAQGTMGIVTWANLKIEHMPKMDKILFAPVDDLEYALEFLYRILRLRIGQECLLLNDVDLAAIVAENGREDFEKVRASLPPWTLILVLSGMERRPEEKIACEEEALRETTKNEFREMSLVENLPGLPAFGKRLLEMLRSPWPKEGPYWKNRLKGACQSLFFITKPVLAPKLIQKMGEVAAEHGVPMSEVGGYLQPIEHNRACHLEFNFFYDPTSREEIERTRTLYRSAALALLNEGVLFTRPYGELASIVYERAASYAMTLRRVKDIFDSNHIMNPGQLCF
jgi:FAD/FMN-containing dehydrogenase